jgi:hypothetical protein
VSSPEGDSYHINLPPRHFRAGLQFVPSFGLIVVAVRSSAALGPYSSGKRSEMDRDFPIAKGGLLAAKNLGGEFEDFDVVGTIGPIVAPADDYVAAG